MVELITDIIQRAPELNIVGFDVSLSPGIVGSSMAIFHKGRDGTK